MDRRLLELFLSYLGKFYTLNLINNNGVILTGVFKGLTLPWNSCTFTEDEKATLVDFITHAKNRNKPLFVQRGPNWKINATSFNELNLIMNREYERLYN